MHKNLLFFVERNALSPKKKKNKSDMQQKKREMAFFLY